jgi:hypothetical protein
LIGDVQILDILRKVLICVDYGFLSLRGAQATKQSLQIIYILYDFYEEFFQRGNYLFFTALHRHRNSYGRACGISAEELAYGKMRLL